MQQKNVWKTITASMILTGAAVITPIMVTACSNPPKPTPPPSPDDHNAITDFDFEVSTIYDYAKALTDKDEIPPHVDDATARMTGIIIKGWKDGKPHLKDDGKTVYVNLADEYDVGGTKYPVVALGQLCFGQEMYDDWSTTNGPKYQYEFVLPSSLRIMFNSACSWFGAIPTEMLPICVNSIKGFTGKEAKYPHVKVDMSNCNLYTDSEDPFLQSNPFRGAYNYNFAFQNIDEFKWPTNNTKWERIGDDIMEDAYIHCDMDLRGLKDLKAIGHWGCGRWQMPNNDLYLPNDFIPNTEYKKFHLTWEAFNGSRFKDVYWNIRPDKVYWDDDFQLDIDVLNKDIDQLTKWLEETFPDESFLFNLLEPIIENIVDTAAEMWDSGEHEDIFIMGNLEIEHFYTWNPTYWQTYCQPWSKTNNPLGHGDSYPTLFWELGMADCPQTTKIAHFVQYPAS